MQLDHRSIPKDGLRVLCQKFEVFWYPEEVKLAPATENPVVEIAFFVEDCYERGYGPGFTFGGWHYASYCAAIDLHLQYAAGCASDWGVRIISIVGPAPAGSRQVFEAWNAEREAENAKIYALIDALCLAPEEADNHPDGDDDGAASTSMSVAATAPAPQQPRAPVAAFEADRGLPEEIRALRRQLQAMDPADLLAGIAATRAASARMASRRDALSHYNKGLYDTGLTLALHAAAERGIEVPPDINAAAVQPKSRDGIER